MTSVNLRLNAIIVTSLSTSNKPGSLLSTKIRTLRHAIASSTPLYFLTLLRSLLGIVIFANIWQDCDEEDFRVGLTIASSEKRPIFTQFSLNLPYRRPVVSYDRGLR